MNADSYFTIGSTHKVCQDYALHGRYRGAYDEVGVPFVILGDGCSSAPDTDFGSRLLVKAAEPIIYLKDYTNEAMLDSITRNAHTLSRALNLEDDSLCSTLVIGKVQDECFKTLCVGDCTIAAKKGEYWYLTEYEFVSGAPYYLRYELDKDIKKGYFDEFGRIVKKHTWFFGNHTGKNPTGAEISTDASETIVLEDKIFFEDSFHRNEYDAVAIMSDGAGSFIRQVTTETSKQNLSYKGQPLVDILSFKGCNGEFVQRRCQRAFKQFREQGIQNYDDFSIGVITND